MHAAAAAFFSFARPQLKISIQHRHSRDPRVEFETLYVLCFTGQAQSGCPDAADSSGAGGARPGWHGGHLI